MQLFFAAAIQGNTAILDVEETRHMVKVLRLEAGASVLVTDGNGCHYQGLFYPDKGGRALVQIQQVLEMEVQPAHRMHLAVAPTKNIERIEWLLEKATEIGLASFTPLLCNRSERKVVKAERLERIVLAAMKQSGRALLPQINPLVKLSAYLKNPPLGTKLIAHCDANQLRVPIQQAVSESGSYHVLIGPEGDFTPDEVTAALAAAFQPVTLGAFRLRTETAALYACMACTPLPKI